MATVTVALLVVAVTVILSAIVSWVVHRYKKHQILKRYGIPGPKPNFFDGHLQELRKHPTPHKLVDSWLRKYGKVFGYYIGEEPFIVVNDVDIIKHVMIKDFTVFPNRPDFFVDMEPFPTTIIGLTDLRWKEVRTIMTPTFSTSKLKLLKTIFDKKVDFTVDVVGKKVENNEMFDIYKIIQGLTLDVIAHCALAMKTRCQENPKDKLLVAMSNFNLQDNAFNRQYGRKFPFLKPFLNFLASYMTPHGNINSIIMDNLRNVISERQKNPEFRSMDVLQLLMDNSDFGERSSTKLTTDEVITNAYLTLLAGFETTSTALAYTFYLLVKHPEIQERLFQEIDQAPDGSYTTLQGLQYLGQVIDESLRIYPPVTEFNTRICKKDHTIGSYTFPKGSVIHIPVWQLHHDPDLFPDPWKFEPDRFSPENKKSIKSMSFQAFGEGPRNCIGMRFALLEIKLAIFKLLKNFEFIPCERTEEDISLITPTVVTNPAKGVWVRAVPRDSK